MADNSTHSLTSLTFNASRTATARTSGIEDEVVALFDRLRAPVFRYLLSLRIAPNDAEEILQEVFLALFQHLSSGKPRDNLQGWIFRVAHHAALKQHGRLRDYAERFRSEPDLSDFAVDPNPGPEEVLSATQRQQRLLAILHALPEREQCCLSLRAEGLRYREIAEVLGISLGSVAAALGKALSRLSRAGETEGF